MDTRRILRAAGMDPRSRIHNGYTAYFPGRAAWTRAAGYTMDTRRVSGAPRVAPSSAIHNGYTAYIPRRAARTRAAGNTMDTRRESDSREGASLRRIHNGYTPCLRLARRGLDAPDTQWSTWMSRCPGCSGGRARGRSSVEVEDPAHPVIVAAGLVLAVAPHRFKVRVREARVGVQEAGLARVSLIEGLDAVGEMIRAEID